MSKAKSTTGMARILWPYSLIAIAAVTTSILFPMVSTFSVPTASAQAGLTAESQEAPSSATSQTLQLPSDNEGFTIVPAYPTVKNRYKFAYEIKPGQQIDDYVAVKNLSGKAQNFLLYATNTTTSNEGTIAYKTRAEMGSGPADWIKFENPQIALQGQEASLQKFTVQVPSNTPVGDYQAGIAMEKTKQDINNPGITIASRLIIHVQIKVTQTPQPIAKSSLPAFTIKQDGSNFKTYYFWISLGLFIISLALLIWTWANEKRQQRKTGTHASPNGKSSAHVKPAEQSAKSEGKPHKPKTRKPRAGSNGK